VRTASLLRQVVGVEETVIEGIVKVTEDRVVVAVRPRDRQRHKCPICGRRGRSYDRGGGRRLWRHMRLGVKRLYLEAEAPRISCRKHGVKVAAVPWARPRSGFTRFYEDEVAWLATQTSKQAVVSYLGISWRTVGSIITRVVDEGRRKRPPLSGLRLIGIDETSYRKGHRYLTVVMNHETGTMVWAAQGARGEVLAQFFEELGPKECAKIEAVSKDAAKWIAKTVSAYCPQAIQCMDPFHVVRWVVDAIETCRRQLWQDARSWGNRIDTREYRDLRWILLRNPEHLTDEQRTRLASVRRLNAPLYRAYLMKEQLREVFTLGGDSGIALLDEWLSWARRCRIESMVRVARAVTENLPAIHATLRLGLSNARSEAMNGRFQLINRRAYGFRSATAAISLAYLCLGGFCPTLPGYR